MAETYSFGALT